MTKELLPVPLFSEIYSIPKTSVYELFKSGDLRRVKVGRRTYVARADAEDWLNKLRATAPAHQAA